MRAFHTRAVVLGALLATSVGVSACRRTYVVVPRPATGYSSVDTLRGRSDGRDVRVTFHFDTTWRVDTVRLGGTDTVVVRNPVRPRLPGTPTGVPSRTDTVRVTTSDTIRVTSRDTIRITVRDTIRLIVRDTVYRADTLRLQGRRMLFVPPGQYPPLGQCRVWIHDRAPGQQARAAPCNALGTIPAGAFILFGGDAWDADYDWVAESQRGSVPPEIIAVSRRRGGRS